MARRAFLTPESLTPVVCVSLHLPESFIPILLGQLSEMGYASNWEQFGTVTPSEAEQAALTALQTLEGCGDSLEDIRISGGIIQKTFDGETWIDVGAIDAFTVDAETLPAGTPATADFDGSEITFGIPAGFDGVDGIDGEDGAGASSEGYKVISDASVEPYDPLNPDSIDKYCFASHMLAVEYADFTADFMEYIRLQVSLAAPTIEYAASVLTSWLPAFDNIAPATIEFATEIALASYDFALGQIGDIDALAFASEKIFCALRLSYPNYDNMFDHIDFPAGITVPEISEVLSDANLFELSNWDDILEFGLSTFVSGEEWGWITLFVARLNQMVAEFPLAGTEITNALKSPNKLSIVVPEMMARATYFDSRNCEMYDCPDDSWCFEWTASDLNNGDWNARINSESASPMASYDASGWNDVLLFSSALNRWLRYCHIQFDFGENVTLQSIEYDLTYSAGSTANPPANSIWEYDSPSSYTHIETFAASGGTFEFVGTRSTSGLLISVNVGQAAPPSTDPGGNALITRVRLCGIGTNPFNPLLEIDPL